MIRKGELKVGDKLPKEADLAREIGVGRSSLREGMKILAAYGVVEPRQQLNGEGKWYYHYQPTDWTIGNL